MRILEGALRRIVATNLFTGNNICLACSKEALKDLINFKNLLTKLKRRLSRLDTATLFKLFVSAGALTEGRELRWHF